MSCIDVAGQASFSTSRIRSTDIRPRIIRPSNIRKSGQMASKVESEAFRVCRRPARRARVAEGRAQQRAGAGGTEGSGTATPRAARAGGRSRGRDGRGGGRRGSPDFGPGKSYSRGGTDHVGELFARRVDGDDLTTGIRNGARVVCGAGNRFTASVFTASGFIARADERRTAGFHDHQTDRARRGRAGSEFLVDRRVGRGSISRPVSDQPRGGEVLVGARSRQLFPFGPPGRPEPSLYRPSGSPSSDVDDDVRSAP